MNGEASEAISLLVPGVLGLVFVVLGATAWWLFRLRRRHEMRQELAEELAQCVRRLGLGTVWQAPLFQADVYGIRGLVNGFDVRAELWDKSTHEFFRLSLHFPQSTRQEIRIRAGLHGGMEKLWRMEQVEVGDATFDETYDVYCRRGDDEQVDDVLTAKVRRLLLSVAKKADGVKIGNHSLYLFVDEGVDVKSVERIIRDALAATVELYNRAREVGPVRAAEEMAYDRVSIDVLGRESGEFDEEDFPTGTGGFPKIDAGDGDTVSQSGRRASGSSDSSSSGASSSDRGSSSESGS